MEAQTESQHSRWTNASEPRIQYFGKSEYVRVADRESSFGTMTKRVVIVERGLVLSDGSLRMQKRVTLPYEQAQLLFSVPL